jgi:hypothetical protein
MNLPIPEFRESCLPKDATIRNLFLEFQKWVRWLERTIKTELRFSKDHPVEFPLVLASWLLASLQRVRVTSWGVIAAVNSDNEVLFVLAVRALIESTAYVAYVDKKLRETYDGKLTRWEMTHLALRMKFSNRTPADFEFDKKEAQLTSAVNVLTAIGCLDSVMKEEIGVSSPRLMTKLYEQLCELCHPNMLGNSIGSELDYPGGIETFDIEPGLREGIRDQFGRYLGVILPCFGMLYNRCWERMFDKCEPLPQWTPPTDPRIVPES